MVRILSCNLFCGRADADALVALVRARQVDVVCAQELSSALAERLAGIFDHADLRRDGRVRGNGMACRHPAAFRRIPIPQRSGCVARLEPGDWPGLAAPMEIVSLHIAAPHLWPWFPRRVRRHAQLETLLADRELAEPLPHAVIGDFNATPAWPVYRRMAQRYEDAALAAGARPGPTWPNLPRWGVNGVFRIDHCFVRGLAVDAFETVALPGSDHRGLLVEVSVEAGRRG